MSVQKVQKSSGKKQNYSELKLKRSLYRAGVPKDMVADLVEKVNERSLGKEPTTQDIHEHVYNNLKKTRRVLAAKYNLKRALGDLGPSGYPFEQFIGRLLTAKGYKATTNRIVKGKCVSHEIDVLGEKDNKHFIFECKFHNRSGYKSDVQTVLYMKARYDDIRLRWEALETGEKKHLHKVWVVTNTSFTSEARKYAQCSGMGLMSWRAPAGHSLAELIEETGLHPITALTSLTKKQKQYIVSHDLVLCREAEHKKKVLIRAGVRGSKLERVIKEAKGICAMQ
jgi:hypothetical protein